MAVKLRLKRMGAKKRPTYRIVATDSRKSRDLEKYFNKEEHSKLVPYCRQLLSVSHDVLQNGDFSLVKRIIISAVKGGHYRRNKYGLNPIIHNLETALFKFVTAFTT